MLIIPMLNTGFDIVCTHIVLLQLAGKKQVREVCYSEVSGEPGATFYGYVPYNVRYMSIVPLATTAAAGTQTAPVPAAAVVSTSGRVETQTTTPAATAAVGTDDDVIDSTDYVISLTAQPVDE